MTIKPKHGYAGTPEYKIWGQVKNKCFNPRDPKYRHCGGAGVTMFEPWVDNPQLFCEYIGPRPSSNHRLERYPNRKGNFEPGNLRWHSLGVTEIEGVTVSAAQALVGTTHGKLTVERAYGVRLGNGKRHAKISCRCQCGKHIDIFWTSLRTRRNLSCGCDNQRYLHTAGEKNRRFKGYREIRGNLWKGYQFGAKTRGLEFSITQEYVWQLYEAQGRLCKVSGVPIQFGSKKNPTTASLDRIDPQDGYVEGNVQWVHKTVNVMRNALTIEEFLVWCQRVVATLAGTGTT